MTVVELVDEDTVVGTMEEAVVSIDEDELEELGETSDVEDVVAWIDELEVSEETTEVVLVHGRGPSLTYCVGSASAHEGTVVESAAAAYMAS